MNDAVFLFEAKYLKFYNFYKEAFKELNPNTPYVENWHAIKMCRILEAETYRIFAGEPKTKDIIINVPFRTGKSEITTICWNAWSWIINPSMSFLTVSYSASLSIDHARKTRNLIESDWYQSRFGHIYKISPDQKAKGHFENNKKGERYATSTTGTATGMGGDVILFDDPMNPKEADSDIERANANRSYSDTFYSRTRNPETAVRVIIMQRLHEDDTTGHLLKKAPEQYRHYCIPAEIDNNVKPESWKKYYVDGLFWHNRFTKKLLSDYKTSLGSYAYAGQLQQKPAPTDGGIWQRWLKPIQRKDIPQLVSIGTDWDTAYTDKETNAANAYVTSGIDSNHNIYIIDAGYFWAETPELVERMKTKQAPHYIEAKATGKSAVQYLNRANITAIEIQVDGGDKIARTRLVTPTAEAGRVYVAEDLLDMIYYDDKQGILSFPNSSHKDLNDALVQAIQRHSYTQLAFY